MKTLIRLGGCPGLSESSLDHFVGFVMRRLISLLSVELEIRQEKLHNRQKIQLQHFDLFFASAATATVVLLTSWQLAEKQHHVYGPDTHIASNINSVHLAAYDLVLRYMDR